MARKMGASTRFPSLNLGTGGGGQSISWDANGVSILASPSKIYRELFVQGTEKEVEQQVNNLTVEKVFWMLFWEMPNHCARI